MTINSNGLDPHDARSWTHEIGKRIQAARQSRGLTAQGLSDLTETYGYGVSRNTIASVETGRKELITLKELVTIARALEVAPLALMYPLDVKAQASIPADPPTSVPGWHAARWFTGEYALPAEVDDDRADEYGRGDYDVDTGLYDWYELPRNEVGAMKRIRKLERLTNAGQELIDLGRSLLEQLRLAETASARDTWRSAVMVTGERAAGIVRSISLLSDELDAVGYVSRDLDRLVAALNELASDVRDQREGGDDE